jgi:hypothetical protein
VKVWIVSRGWRGRRKVRSRRKEEVQLKWRGARVEGRRRKPHLKW